MSRTDLDPSTIARGLRRMAGDGSIEWVMEPIQASVLLDVADALDENAKLRELVRILKNCADECGDCDTCPINDGSGVLNPWLGCDGLRDRMRDLGVEVDV